MTYDALLFNQAFLLLLAAVTATRWWLAVRQIRHVSAHRNQVPSAFQSRISLADHQKAADYTCAKVDLRIIHTLMDTLLLLLFTVGGLLDTLNLQLSNLLGSGWAHDLALVGSVLLIGAVIEMPLGSYGTFRLEARFGFNRMTLRLYLMDLLRELLVTLIVGVPVFLSAVWMMNSLGSLWWLWAWVAWMVFNILVLALYPTLIAPLFNRFSPLPEGELRQRVETLLHRCGFRSSGLFVMDGSKRSNHGNAYFTGFGKTKRVVFFDTLLERLTPSETEAVLAHELGHFHGRHVLQRIALLFALSLVFLGILGALKEAPWFYQGLGVSTPGTALCLILFMLVAPVFTFVLQPLMSLYSRRHEFEADAYATRHASAALLVSALVKLYQDNASTLTPDPVHSAVYDSHPPASVRIAHIEAMPHA
jgi:STE24 endopeptidase